MAREKTRAGVSIHPEDAVDAGLWMGGDAVVDEAVFTEYDYGGTMKRKPRWTGIETSMMREWYSTMDTVELAAKVRHSVSEVFAKANGMGLLKAHPRLARARVYAAKFGMTPKLLLRFYDLDQLDACADDSTRRLVLGVSEQFDGTFGYPERPVKVYKTKRPTRRYVRRRTVPAPLSTIYSVDRMLEIVSMKWPVRAEAGTVKARTA